MAILDFEVSGFVEGGAADAKPMGGGLDHVVERDSGRAEELVGAGGVPDPGVGAFAAGDAWRTAEGFTELMGQAADGDPLKAGDIEGGRRSGGVGEALEGTGIGVTLPNHVGVAHGDIDGHVGGDLLGDVEEHAVAEVDGVAEAEEEGGGVVLAGEVGEEALATDAGVGILAGWRERCVLAGAGAGGGQERIDAAGGEDDAAGVRVTLRNGGGDKGVHGPGEFRGVARAELLAGEVENVRGVWQGTDRGRV